ncbi:Scramblase-domain-containing protein [Dentipellis sp. KUC8613]|nr:Scramblase-domain-containing protein [Dentipellis sp. KUC8613]
MLSRSCLGFNPLARHSAFRILPVRSYALSRFPDRGPAGGRVRKPPSPAVPRKTAADSEHSSPWEHEDVSSGSTSRLWQESGNRSIVDTEDGLTKLLLENDTLVVTRQLEMLNIFVGFEQTNKYAISNLEGEPLGFIAEEPRGFLSIFARQVFRTHRPFRAIIMDREGTPVLWIRRPFDWINSRMYVQRLKGQHETTADGAPVLDTFGEAQQRWHLWRRRYDLFMRDTPRRILSVIDEPQPEPDPDPEQFTQLAAIDEGLWAWHFTLRGAQGEEIASVNRAFRGFGREIFTDTAGQYHVNFTPELEGQEGILRNPPTRGRELTLEQRALILAMAVNIDFDYFSRHSEGG